MFFLHSPKMLLLYGLDDPPNGWKIDSWFDWFFVSTERWKETAPWKRKFRCICLKSENINIENEGATSKNFWNFWNLAFQNEKIDGEWTVHMQNITSAPHRTSSPWIEIFSPPQKTQNSNSLTNPSRGCTPCYPCSTIYSLWKNFFETFPCFGKVTLNHK